MKIEKVENNDVKDLISFNSKIFPDKVRMDESIYYRFYDNPFSINFDKMNFVARDIENNIVGQILMMPSELIYKNAINPVYWAMDFYVDEASRGITGFLLARQAISAKNHFGIGLSKIALDLHLALGIKIVGSLIKYYKFSTIFSIFRFLRFKKAEKFKSFFFPETIKAGEDKFIKIYNPKEIIASKGCWNENLVEFTRSEKFLRWRFFYHKDKYFIYKYLPNIDNSDLTPTYFVVRPIIWRGVNCLLLVDYRFTVNTKNLFESILQASSNLAKSHGMAVTILGCSLPNCDQLIRKKKFLRLGNKSVIVTKYLNKEVFTSNEDIIFATIADSDCEFYYD